MRESHGGIRAEGSALSSGTARVKIASCVKYSLDVAEIRVDVPSKQLRLAGVPRKLGNIDKNVLETAVALKEAHGGSVHAVSFGPPEAKDALLREALAMGADEATVVIDPFDGALDPSATAAVLASALTRLGGFDIVVCGEASDDDSTYQVGPRLAESLGWPQVTYVRDVSVEGVSLVAERDVGVYSERVRARLPVLITVTEETNTPRRPTLMDVLKAKKKPLAVWQLEADLGISPASLQEASPLQFLRSEAVLVSRKQVLLCDRSVSDLASELVERLVQEGVLEGCDL